jgi:hypothetical protein
MTTQDEGHDRLDLRTYERLIEEGIAAADGRGAVVDHVTARRLAIWLASRPQTPDLARGLVRFIQTGAISQNMKTQLRVHARSGTHPYQPQAARLMEYCVARGADRGPVGWNFGKACDEIDRADVMLAGLRNRMQQACSTGAGMAGHRRPPGHCPSTPGSSRSNGQHRPRRYDRQHHHVRRRRVRRRQGGPCPRG